MNAKGIGGGYPCCSLLVISIIVHVYLPKVGEAGRLDEGIKRILLLREREFFKYFMIIFYDSIKEEATGEW